MLNLHFDMLCDNCSLAVWLYIVKSQNYWYLKTNTTSISQSIDFIDVMSHRYHYFIVN